MSLGATISAPATASETAVFASKFQAGVILDLVLAPRLVHDAAMTMRGVLAQADVGDHHQILERSRSAFNARNPVCTIPAGSHAPLACSSFSNGTPNNNSPPSPSRAHSAASFTASSDGQVKNSGHRTHRLANALTRNQKQRIDQRTGTQVRLPHQRPQSLGPAETAHAGDWKFHPSILRPEACDRQRAGSQATLARSSATPPPKPRAPAPTACRSLPLCRPEP